MRRAIIVIVATAFLATIAGVAVASIPDGTGLIHGCRSNKDGSLRVIDTATTANCPNGFTALNWNQTGPQGPQGVQGPAGPQGPQGEQGPAGTNGVSGYELVTQDFPIIGSNMHELVVNCPAGKVPLGGAFVSAAGPTWDPNLVGGYGSPTDELTATGYRVWSQAGSTSYNTVHVTLTCATVAS